MSVLLEFSMFPTDVGESKSAYVSGVIAMVRDSGYPYQLTPMSTIIETETLSQALDIVNMAYDVLSQSSDRVYSTIKLDIRKNKNGRLTGKIKSIEDKIGKVNK